jgi:hypothetical protein
MVWNALAMPRGVFVQSAAILCSSPPSLTEIQQRLPGAVPTQPGSGWEEPGPGWWVPWHGQRLLVDYQASRWPDEMTEPAVRSAWAAGWLGPTAYPGGLQRAVDHNALWSDGGAAVEAHRGVLRIGLESEQEPSLEQIEQVTKVATLLLELPQALAYFNPNGEVLLSRSHLIELTQFARTKGRPPYDLWCNLRLFGAGEDWAVIDSVGMGQFGQRDHEICFPSSIDRVAAANVAHNLCHYQVSSRPDFHSGDTVDGPGGPWVTLESPEGFRSPARPTLRWFSQAYDPPEELLSALGSA